MPLDLKRENEIVPQYSLTGDLISYLRCGLQYRYHNGSSLPPSRPVQLWFGEFIHGVMEAAYRIRRDTNPTPQFPWPANPKPYRGGAPMNRLPHDIGTIGDTVENTLRATGKNPRNANVRDSAYRRAELAVNEFGPHLFPLIASAEEKVIGTRNIPQSQSASPPRARLYELHGVIDVLSNIQLTGASETNIIKRAIQNVHPGLSGQFEVIVDYKGTRRPATNHSYWNQGDWQVQTYAWLRMRVANSLPVVAGVLLHINELAPSAEDLVELKREIQQGNTDIAPANGTHDYYLLNTWRSGDAVPDFSQQFRIARAIRIVPVTQSSQTLATQRFDDVVLKIEGCAIAEAHAGAIIGHWAPNGDDDTCAACDFRHFCPAPAPRTGQHIVTAPTAP